MNYREVSEEIVDDILIVLGERVGAMESIPNGVYDDIEEELTKVVEAKLKATMPYAGEVKSLG